MLLPGPATLLPGPATLLSGPALLLLGPATLLPLQCSKNQFPFGAPERSPAAFSIAVRSILLIFREIGAWTPFLLLQEILHAAAGPCNAASKLRRRRAPATLLQRCLTLQRS